MFSLAALLSALNFTITVIDLRAQGMTLARAPVTVWAWFITAILSLLIFSILLAGCCTILSDRMLGSNLFSGSPFLERDTNNLVRQGNLPLLWQRLFWYFAQAEVYIAMIPCFGFVTHIIATFARKPVWKERLVVLSLCGVGVAGFSVWGYHMFATGMNPFMSLAFSILAASLGIPSAFLLASWLGTLWSARFRLTTAMLFAIGFISLFVSGGLTGLFLAQRQMTSSIVSQDFVTGHFHLVMGIAATFALLSALFFWFPALFAARMNETLGKIHFWATFAGVYAIFMPLHWMGMLTQSTMLSESQRLTLTSASTSLRTLVAVATICTVSAQAIFIFNFLHTLRRRKPAPESNPWRATTLEWIPASPENPALFQPIVYRGAYEFHAGSADDFRPQHIAPERLAQKII